MKPERLHVIIFDAVYGSSSLFYLLFILGTIDDIILQVILPANLTAAL